MWLWPVCVCLRLCVCVCEFHLWKMKSTEKVTYDMFYWMPVAFSCLSQHTSKLNKVSTNYHHHHLLLLHQQIYINHLNRFIAHKTLCFRNFGLLFLLFSFRSCLSPSISLIRLGFDICSFEAFSRICWDMITLMHGHILTLDRQNWKFQFSSKTHGANRQQTWKKTKSHRYWF